MLRGGVPKSTGDFLESLSQAILLGIILVGRLGVTPGHIITMITIIIAITLFVYY